jgi:hypothetical protein
MADYHVLLHMQAPLARVVLGMAIRTVRGDSSIPNNTWHQGIQGSRVLEECLIWLTLIARCADMLVVQRKWTVKPSFSRATVPLLFSKHAELPSIF